MFALVATPTKVPIVSNKSEITSVNIGVRKNPAILVSGHDLKDLEMLLLVPDPFYFYD